MLQWYFLVKLINCKVCVPWISFKLSSGIPLNREYSRLHTPRTAQALKVPRPFSRLPDFERRRHSRILRDIHLGWIWRCYTDIHSPKQCLNTWISLLSLLNWVRIQQRIKNNNFIALFWVFINNKVSSIKWLTII